jgi:hypothetical protein
VGKAELVKGEMVEMPPAGEEPGATSVEIMVHLHAHARRGTRAGVRCQGAAPAGATPVTCTHALPPRANPPPSGRKRLDSHARCTNLTWSAVGGLVRPLVRLPGCSRLYIRSCMANALAPWPFDSLKPDLCIATLLSRFQCWHGQNQNAIAIGGVGQHAVYRLRQDDITVVWPNRPLRDQDFRLILARTAVFAANGHPVAADGYRNVLRLQPRHRRGQDKAISGLMELHWNALRLL